MKRLEVKLAPKASSAPGTGCPGKDGAYTWIKSLKAFDVTTPPEVSFEQLAISRHQLPAQQ